MKAAEKNLFMKDVWTALGGRAETLKHLAITGTGGLSSAYPVTDLASAAVSAASLSIAELISHSSGTVPDVVVDRRLASFWFGLSIRPIGWTMPGAWNSIAGDYRTRDGWIRLHTNAPHHRAAAERILGSYPDKESMANAVITWQAEKLETEIIETGGCAAAMKSPQQWAVHPQGQALSVEPLAEFTTVNQKITSLWQPAQARPLAGLKILDLTRVLAGPIASRFLAGYGADVLRIDPPHWDEPGVIPEVTLGKRCTRLDLENTSDRRIFEDLLSQADILIHGYRPGALDSRGYGETVRRKISPGLIDVSLNAYGWTGPWRNRRGFDSLVQMSSGIAHAGMNWKGIDIPTPLPVQALDQATGYLMAAAAVRGLITRMVENKPTTARLSLARTARLMTDYSQAPSMPELAPETTADVSPDVEPTAWGDARRLRPPAIISGAPMHWSYPALALGSSTPSWQGEPRQTNTRPTQTGFRQPER